MVEEVSFSKSRSKGMTRDKNHYLKFQKFTSTESYNNSKFYVSNNMVQKSTKQHGKNHKENGQVYQNDRKFYYFSFRNRSSREKLVKI